MAEKVLRPIIVYFFMVIGLRLAGKRELAQLNPFDLVRLLTLSSTAQKRDHRRRQPYERSALACLAHEMPSDCKSQAREPR